MRLTLFKIKPLEITFHSVAYDSEWQLFDIVLFLFVFSSTESLRLELGFVTHVRC